jgi:hypothetical protein
MTGSLMRSVISRGVRDIEVPHELLKVCQRGSEDHMKVILHEYVREDLRLIDLRRAL